MKTLKDFIDSGMLNHLDKERRFFETPIQENGRTEIYWVTRHIKNGTYEFSYVTKKGEKKEETIDAHLKDKYIGNPNDLVDILLRRMLSKHS